jgi:Reverse transcriptase (RNA-dependent DNA polymerase)
MFTRITNKIVEHKLLIGANTYVLPGTSTHDSLLPLNVFINETKRTGKQGHLLLEDKSAALDSITFKHIGLALKHIGVPISFENLYISMINSRSCSVFTIYGLSPAFAPTRGVPQGGVKSPLIRILCYDISLARLRLEKKCFSSTIFPMLASPSLDEMLSGAKPLEIQLISFMDDLAIFYNNRDNMIYGTKLLTSFNKTVGIRANPSKSAYIAINCPNKEPIDIDGVPINYANPKTKHRLLGAFLCSAHGTRELVRHAKGIIKNLTSQLRQKLIGPARLQCIINSVIVPSAAYQLFFCLVRPSSLRGLSSIIASTIKNTLRQPKDFPLSILFNRNAFGAKEPEAASFRNRWVICY